MTTEVWVVTRYEGGSDFLVEAVFWTEEAADNHISKTYQPGNCEVTRMEVRSA